MKNLKIEIDPETLSLQLHRYLTARGLDAVQSHAITAHLVRAERRGYSSHGICRLPAILKLLNVHIPFAPRVTSEAAGFKHIDAANALGIPAIDYGLASSVDSAKTAGANVIAITNYRGTTGCLGIYAAQLAEQGFASIMMCSSEFAVAPHGSRRAVLGTNPIAVGIPSTRFPLVTDMATSAWSYGAIKDAMTRGVSVPMGIVQTEAGTPSQDPHDADNGSQLPMAGHKGFGLGLAIELLCGPLIGGKGGRDAVPGSDGFLAIIIRIDVTQPEEKVRGNVEAVFQEIRRGPLAEGFESIRIPGERGSQAEEQIKSIPVDSDIWNMLSEAAP